MTNEPEVIEEMLPAVVPAGESLPAQYEPPAQVIARAKEQAQVLMDIVEDKKLYAMIQGKKYLEAEAWETILAFNNVSPVEVATEAVKDSKGNTAGWKSTMSLVNERTGVEVARASMICGLDDFPCQGKVGSAAHRAAMSAAQTWAVSKAARIKFSWVAVLAEYAPTPASEMDRNATGGQDHGVCAEHNVPYFQSPRMRSAAHKTSDGGWCNKPKTLDEIANRNAAAAAATEPEEEQETLEW